MDEQTKQLKRVRVRIGDVVLDYCHRHREFQMADLSRYIVAIMGGAPDSPSRILRDLRQRGLVEYTVTSRKDSAYQVTWAS